MVHTAAMADAIGALLAQMEADANKKGSRHRTYNQLTGTSSSTSTAPATSRRSSLDAVFAQMEQQVRLLSVVPKAYQLHVVLG